MYTRGGHDRFRVTSGHGNHGAHVGTYGSFDEADQAVKEKMKPMVERLREQIKDFDSKTN